MGDSLAALRAEYNQENQETKRDIGAYLYERPTQWISQQKLASEFDKDNSVISRHLDDFDDENYIDSIEINQERNVQWAGRGAGGIRYWAHRLLPQQLWRAGSELRPLLTLDRLGGAYLPTIIFGLLMILGLVMGVTTYLIAEFELGSVFGYTARDILVFTGICTMGASVLLFTAILWRLLVWGVSASGLLSLRNNPDSVDESE